MITLIEDRYQASAPPEDALTPTDSAMYVVARIQLRRALDTHSNLTIYLNDPVMLYCFEDLRRYPHQVVCWHTINPAQDFEHFFGVAPNAPFTHERIIDLHLENMRQPPDQRQVDPLAWILGERLGEVWGYVEPSTHHLTELVGWAMNAQPLNNATLRELATAQLQRWALSDERYAALRIRTLPEDAAAIIVHSALRRYDLRWRGAQPWGSAPLLDQEPPTELCGSTLRAQQARIGQYWRQHYAMSEQSAEMIRIALDQMSGMSEIELNELAIMLTEHPERLTATLMQRIRQQFGRISEAEQTLDELEQRVNVPTPTEPDMGWSAERWLRWASQEYLRYFVWVIRSGAGRAKQCALATSYSDWLYTHYPAMLRDDHAPLITGQFSQLRELLDTDAQTLVVWLVIDGFTWWQGELMRAACERYGLYVQTHESRIAILPSITGVAKRALVTGVPTSMRHEPNVAESARIQLERAGIPAFVTYSAAEALARTRDLPELRCVLLLYNTIDVLAHQTTRMTDDPGIRAYLDTLARELGQFRDMALGRGYSFHALIGSDHGSTLLPTNAQILALPPSAREIDDPWEPQSQQVVTSKPSPRAAEIATPERIPVDEQPLWYVLDRQRFDLDRHYLVPRGERYIGRRPPGWTHGGLTPEETVVPLLHLSLERIELTPLMFTMKGTLRARQDSTVKLHIVNPNRVPIDDLVINLGYDIAPIQIERIKSLGLVEQEMTFLAPATNAGELLIDWQIRYNAIGTTHDQHGQEILPIRRLQTTDSSFDDFFGM